MTINGTLNSSLAVGIFISGFNMGSKIKVFFHLMSSHSRIERYSALKDLSVCSKLPVMFYLMNVFLRFYSRNYADASFSFASLGNTESLCCYSVLSFYVDYFLEVSFLLFN